MLRKVNNWAKAGMNISILDQRQCLNVLSPQDIKRDVERLEKNGSALLVSSDKPEYLCVDFDVKYQATIAPEELRKYNVITKKGKKKPSPMKVKVIDICCGRGGDINKLSREFDVDFYLGMDISLEELYEAEDRAYNLSKKSKKSLREYKFIHGDAGDSTCTDVIKSIKELPHKDFDMACCQFALHYFCDKEERIINLFKIVSDLLKPGSRFCASFPNPYHIVHRLKKNERPPHESGALCSVERSESVVEKVGDFLSSFGVEYIFSLGDAVKQCKEYIVPIHRVIELAESCGLEVITLLPMQDYIISMTKDDETCALREVMGVGKDMARPLDDEEWKAIGVYMIAAWQKAKV